MSWTCEITERGTLLLFGPEGFCECWSKLIDLETTLKEIDYWRQSRVFPVGPVKRTVRHYFMKRAASSDRIRRNSTKGPATHA